MQPCEYTIVTRKFENNLTTKVENKEILITKLGGTFWSTIELVMYNHNIIKKTITHNNKLYFDFKLLEHIYH